MKITKIRIIDFLGISAFAAEKPGKLNIIKGPNGSGKSSILKAITEAFKSSGKDPNIVRTGADTAEIMIELDESILIERKITADKNQVSVKENGERMNAPQTFLNSILGEFQFNPVDFFLSDIKRKREILLSTIDLSISSERIAEALDGVPIPIDLTKFDYSRHGLEVLEAIKKETYNRRHEQGINVTRLEKSLELDARTLPEGFDPDRFAQFNFTDAMAKLKECNAIIAEQHKRESARLELRSRAESLVDRIAEAKKELSRMESELSEIQSRGTSIAAEIESFDRPDVESIEKEIADFQAAQKQLHHIEAMKAKAADLKSQQVLHADLDLFYKSITGDVPRKLLAEADMPIEGLEIGESWIKVNGVDIDKLSTSEQISFSVRIAKAKSGKLRVICVDRWESLDEDSQSIFAAEAEKDDFECFVTQVQKGTLHMEGIG